MLSSSKSVISPVVNIVAKACVNVHPNLLTLVGLISPIGFLYFMIIGMPLYSLCFLLLAPFDMLDGAVARLTGKANAFGGLLDSTVDRVSDGLYISAFGFAGYVGWQWVTTLLITSYLISYIRSRAELSFLENGGQKGDFSLAVGIVERTERLLGIGILTIFIILGQFKLLNIGIYILLGLSIITVLQRLHKADEELK